MNGSIKKFLEDNIELIKNNEWEKFCNKLVFSPLSCYVLPDILDIIESSAIDIIGSIDYIPSRFYALYLNGRIKNYTINTTSPHHFTTLIDIENVSIQTPPHIKTINSLVINCLLVNSFIVNDGCEILNAESFAGSDNLFNLWLPKSIKYIDECVVDKRETIVHYAGTKSDWDKIIKSPKWALFKNKVIFCETYDR